MVVLHKNTLNEITPSVDELIQDTLSAARKHLGLEVSFISEFKDGQRIFRYVDAELTFCPINVGDSGPLEESYCQRVVDGRLPELITDAKDYPEALELSVTTQLPIGAHVSVPIKIGDEVFGTFCCLSRESKPSLDFRDLAVFRLFADFIGRVLSRLVQAQRRTRKLHVELSRVLRDKLFYMVYQPIFHIEMKKVVGYEILTRFTAEPIQSPDRWFNDAGTVGLQAELELAVIRSALTDFKHFPDHAYLSFNLSPHSILDDQVLAVFDDYPLDRIVIEVTEHESIHDYEIVANRLESLRRCGLRLAVDDAGAGYASFRHILKLKPDIIKLDSSLVSTINTDDRSRALASALVRFAEETECKVVAEGVETEDVLEVLRQLNVNKAQGYLLGPPSTLETLKSNFVL